MGSSLATSSGGLPLIPILIVAAIAVALLIWFVILLSRRGAPVQAPPASAPPVAAADAVNSTAVELEKLAALRDQGLLSDAEFDARKRGLLGAG